MSLRKKISQILPEINKIDDNKNYRGKTLNNYRFNIITNKIKNKSIASPSLKTEINYFTYKDNLKISPKHNFYNTEKTEYSSQINDCLSKINGNSEIKPTSNNMYFNDSLSPTPKYKTESFNFYNSSKNIFNNRMNIYPKQKKYHFRNFKTTSCWYSKIDDIKNINKFDLDSIIKFSNRYSNSKTPKIKKRKNKVIKKVNNENGNINENNRFNSLNCFIDNYIEFDENKLLNRYIPNYIDYMSKTDYEKLIKKSRNLLTAKEKIKSVFKDTKLLMAMCDYLNTSLAKLKNEKRKKLKAQKKELEDFKKNKKYKKSLENSIKNNLIPKKNIFKMNIKYNNSFVRKAPLIYKNGYFPKSILFPTSFSYYNIDENDKEIHFGNKNIN